MTRIVYFFERIKDGKQSKWYCATSEDFSYLLKKYNIYDNDEEGITPEVYFHGKYRIIYSIPSVVLCDDFTRQITKKIMKKFRNLRQIENISGWIVIGNKK